ncbi:MAG: tRNA1(Val) (adenine(37)-N6)-methyltransferase [Bacilli bacterium]|nr:tRNA1(Val) (adenine(37)-N6)-methyltransferase [Bacilli bacterium]MBQ6404613.1 tRNA1(Val) (adenine(37)-N6)-methyltransferase [Bacilli bacterium]
MERLDDILGYKNLKIYQNSNYFAFSLDSIILANYANIRLRDKQIVDFCTGNAVIPLILSRRTKAKIYGIEIQEKLAKLAKKSIEYNKLNDQIEIVNEDIKDFSKKNISKFDLVLCNPPYFKINEKSSLNESYEKKIARHEITINLQDVCDCAKKVLKDNGNLCLVHRSDRLMEILEVLRKNNLEPKKIKFVYENINKEATLVLIEAQKLGKVGLKVDKPLILYELDGKLTEEYDRLQKEVLG